MYKQIKHGINYYKLYSLYIIHNEQLDNDDSLAVAPNDSDKKAVGAYCQ